ncbi:MAG: hypothetical protein AAF960_02175 [Bacteroidota bacterium]
MVKHIGIDYGAKLAGTTAICFEKEQQLVIWQSEKKKDADAFVQKTIRQLQPSAVFIDAPLSLPLAYFGEGDNYFYRDCDKELKAMSPMFLGGLTARAIKLSKPFKDNGITFYETYPAQIVKHYLIDSTEGYKKQKSFLPAFCKVLEEKMAISFLETPTNWHQVDSVLAWWAGQRFEQGNVKFYGYEKEGLIYV